MATAKSFEDLEVWQKARVFAKEVHLVSSTGEFSKDFPLRNQINASAGSIMDNIAEGFDRNGNKEFIQFLSIAKGSCSETRSQLYRALDKGYLSETGFEKLKADAISISGKLSNLMNYLRRSDYRGSKYAEPEEDYSTKAFHSRSTEDSDEIEL